VPAPVAVGAGKTAGEDAVFQVTAELPLHIRRHRPRVIVTVAALGEPGLEVFLDAAIECPAAAWDHQAPVASSTAAPGKSRCEGDRLLAALRRSGADTAPWASTSSPVRSTRHSVSLAGWHCV